MSQGFTHCWYSRSCSTWFCRSWDWSSSTFRGVRNSRWWARSSLGCIWRKINQAQVKSVLYHVLIGTNTPSMTDPFKLKYQLIWLRAPEVQSRAGITPCERCIVRTFTRTQEKKKKTDSLGLQSCCKLRERKSLGGRRCDSLISQESEGRKRLNIESFLSLGLWLITFWKTRTWKSLTTVWKNATASAPLTLPLGKHEGTRVLVSNWEAFWRKMGFTDLIQVPWVAHSCYSENNQLTPSLRKTQRPTSQNCSFWPLISTQFYNNEVECKERIIH